MRFLGPLLGRAAILLLAAGSLAIAVAFLLPRQVTLTRETVVDAPPAAVFAHVDSLQHMQAWSPWAGLDPKMDLSFSGPEAGPGNRMAWRSDNDDVGSGSQEIIGSVGDLRVETALDMDGMGMATTWLALEPQGPDTRVTWGMQSDMGRSPVGRYLGLFMDGWVGPDLEKGLAALKDLAETDVEAAAPTAAVAATPAKAPSAAPAAAPMAAQPAAAAPVRP